MQRDIEFERSIERNAAMGTAPVRSDEGCRTSSRESGNRWRLLGVAVALLGAALLFPGPTHADTFDLVDGGTVTGTVLSEDGGMLELWTPDGRLQLERARIEEQKKSRTDYDRYLTKRNRVKNSPKSHLALAKWCEKKTGLEPEAQLHFEMVLALDPDNKVAHQRLGHRKIDGEWRVVAAGAPAEDAPEDPAADFDEDPDFPPFVLLTFEGGEVWTEEVRDHLRIELRGLLRGANRPMHFLDESNGGHEYELVISLSIEKGRRTDFYGHGVQQDWIGRVDARLTRTGKAPKVALRIEDLEKTQPMRANIAEAEAHHHVARESIETLVESLRKHSFMKKRGLRPAR